MKLYKRIIALFSAVSILVGCSLPAFAEYTGKTPSKLLDLWNTATYDVIEGTTGLGGLYNDYVNWCWRGTSGATPRYGSGAGRVPSSVTSSGCKTDTVYNSTDVTNKYTVVNTTNNTWYNPVTNNYNTYNNITYNSTYNTYKITNNTYNTYVTNNYTYVTYCVEDTETQSTWYYEIYYQLPDGRNSYDLKAEDVWGLGLSYDAVNYQTVVEDPHTLALLHFDGNINDSSAYSDSVTYDTGATYDFVDSGFGSALSWTDRKVHSLNVQLPKTLSGDFTIEGYITPTCNADNYLIHGSYSFPSGTTSSNALASLNAYMTSRCSSMKRWLLHCKGDFSLVSYGAFPAETSYSSPYTHYDLADDVTGHTSFFNFGDVGFLGYTLDAPCVNYIDTSSSKGYYYGGLWKPCVFFYDSPLKNTVHCGDGEYSYGDVVYTSGKRIPFSIVRRNGIITYFENGSAVGSYSCSADLGSTLNLYCPALGDCSISWDELRVSDIALYSDTYTPSAQPFDTNKVLALPDSGVENQIAVKSTIPVNGMRIGGVRPTYPTNGYLYVYCDSNNIVQDVQQYQNDGWYSVGACIYKNGKWVTLKGQDLTDITINKPDEPTPTPTPGGGSSSGGSGGSGGGSGGSSSGGGVFDWLADLFGDAVKAIFDGVKAVLKAILKGFFKIVLGLFGWIVKFLLFVNTKYLGGFFPPAMWAVIAVMVPLAFILGLIRFLRGFF